MSLPDVNIVHSSQKIPVSSETSHLKKSPSINVESMVKSALLANRKRKSTPIEKPQPYEMSKDGNDIGFFKSIIKRIKTEEKIVHLPKENIFRASKIEDEECEDTAFNPAKELQKLHALEKNIFALAKEESKLEPLYIKTLDQINELKILYDKYAIMNQNSLSKSQKKEMQSLIETITEKNRSILVSINAIKVQLFGLRALGQAMEINRGAAKVIWSFTDHADYVYITPVSNIFGKAVICKEKEIKAEIAKVLKISQALEEEETKNLALELVELPEQERIHEKFTARAKKAEGDLSQALKKSPDFSIKSGYIKQFLNGMKSLHKAGFVHGDIKPENVLIYADGSIKISDFGKARSIEDKSVIYTGNGRFSSEEGRLSKQGEVYSSALMMISILEAGLLQKNDGMLIAPKKTSSVRPLDKRQGIEKFLIVNKACPQTESNLRGRITFLLRILFRRKYPKAEKEVHRYIDALVDQLIRQGDTDKEKLKSLRVLLKSMTYSNKHARPTMKEVAIIYNDIFPSQ